MLGQPQPKPRPHALVKRDRQAKLKAKDERENKKVRIRAASRCECIERVVVGPDREKHVMRCRCMAPAVGEPHHLISGYGRRNIGPSILANWKIATCRRCHSEIHNRILVPLDPQADALSVIYRRIK